MTGGARIGSWMEAGMCKRVKMIPDSLKQLSEEENPVLIVYELKKQ